MKESPAMPMLNKSFLFLPLPEDQQNPNRKYLQCPATGNIYCISTGSLYQNISQINPLPINISPLTKISDFCALPSNPIPYTIQKSISTKNPDLLVHGNGTTTPSLEINKDPDQCVQSNRASITQSNKAPNIKIADHHTHGNGISATPNVQSNTTSKSKDGDEPIPGTSATSTPKYPSTPKNPSTTSSNVKTDSGPATKKPKSKKKKERKKSKDKSVCTKENLYTNSKKSCKQSKNEAKKQKKCAVLSQSKPTISFIRYSSDFMNTPPIVRVKQPVLPSMLNPVIQTQSQTRNNSVYNPFQNSKKKSFRYSIISLQPMTVPAKPLHINLNHLLYPQRPFPSLSIKQFSQNSDIKFEATSSFTSINKCSSKPAKKPSLRFGREDYDEIDLENLFIKKTAKKKASVKKSYNYNKIWKIMEPFNCRSYYYNKSSDVESVGQTTDSDSDSSIFPQTDYCSDSDSFING